MNATHRAFPIGPGEFDLFNTILLGILSSNGVAPSDVSAVSGVLESTRRAICNQCFLPPPPPPTTTTVVSSTSTTGTPPPQPFILFVQPKTAAHPWQDGFTLGYKIDGTEGGTVTLQVGQTYGFTNMAGCAHPLFISLSDQGAGASPLGRGVVFPNGNEFGTCGGQTLFFTPDATTPATLYYQCQVHLRMGGTINVIGGSTNGATVGGVTSTSAVASTSANPTSANPTSATATTVSATSTSAAATTADVESAASFFVPSSLLALCIFLFF